MTSYQCSSCGRVTDPALPCPNCGAEAPGNLADLDRSIAEMKAREAAIAREQRQIAAQMQAALFQRDVLANAQEERLKQGTRPRRVLRRRADRRPPGTDPAGPTRIPRQPSSTARDVPPPRAGGGTPPPGGDQGHPPEASPREVQNILLGLGALLLGVAAVVFTAVAISSLDDLSRLLILFAATAVMLLVPVPLTRKGLTATAETVAAVGLVLLPLDGYALWTVDGIRAAAPGKPVFAGLTLIVTAAVAALHAVGTGLRVPRYATVIAVQPVLPLLAYGQVSGPAGWAVLGTVVAVVDLGLTRLVTSSGPGWRWLRPQPVPPAGATDVDAARRVVSRPEGDPEESDAVLAAPEQSGSADHPGPQRLTDGSPATDTRTTLADDRAPNRWWRPAPAGGAPRRWWRRMSDGAAEVEVVPVPGLVPLVWALHGIAVVLALGCAGLALLRADTVPVAVVAAGALLLAAGTGLTGALVRRTPWLSDLAAGVFTAALVAGVGRVVAVALPGRALLAVAAVIVLVGVGVRAIPAAARRGPQLASAAALVLAGLVVAGGALRAGLAPVRAALPPWSADLAAYPGRLADAVGPAGWQIATTAFLLTVAAVLALPSGIRREFAVTGAALTAVSTPASFGLGWAAAPWPPVLAAAGIALVGVSARTSRATTAHVVGAGLVGLVGAAAGLARPALTAAVLGAIVVAGVLVALAPRLHITPTAGDVLSGWGAGGAACALPGAVAAAVAASGEPGPFLTPASLREATVPILAASFLAVCATLGYAAIAQLSERRISLPLTLGTGIGTLVVTAAAFGAPGGTAADAWVGTLLLAAATLLFLAPSFDVGGRGFRMLDGADLAAAAATAALIATLARITAVLTPGAQLAAGAGLVLVVAVGARALPEDSRRGPIAGVTLSGLLIGGIAGWYAVIGAVKVLAAPGPIWDADLGVLGQNTAVGWQAPAALVLLGLAAAVLLPHPWRYDASSACFALAAVGTPAALGLPWWSPIVIGGIVATVLATAGTATVDPRGALSRTVAAAAVALHMVAAGLVRPGATAATLGIVVVLGTVVAVLARSVADGLDARPRDEGMPPHLAQIGGMGAAAALLALPGALAAYATAGHGTAEVVLSAALAGPALGVAVLALVGRQVAQYLPWTTGALAAGATVTALAAFPTGLPVGLYAAAAALVGVLAELVRAASPPPALLDQRIRRWSVPYVGVRWRPTTGAGGVGPATGALLVSVVPAALALFSVAPTLVRVLVEPYRVLGRVWQGPPPELRTPPPELVNPTQVLAALLLTLAAGLAAAGFSGGRPARAVPVVLPGAAVTLLILPVSLGQGWPGSTLAALAVFTISMLGLALTMPPLLVERARSLRVARVLVFVTGLAAGGAGLAGSLATRGLTLFTLGGAVLVGAVAALFGATQRARILGWLFASVLGQVFVLTLGLVLGVPAVVSAFGVLAVGAVLLVFAALLPRLRQPEAVREAATVQWSGYAAALIALALAYDSPRHAAALLAAWGAVLGVAASRAADRPVERRILFWAVVGCEIVAWWLLMATAHVALPEVYTLPFAVLALIVGLLELRHHPEVSSWVAYGPALVVAFLPTLAIVLFTDSHPARQVFLLLGAVATLIFGSVRRQQAPVIIGAVVTAITAVHAIFAFGPWLVLIPVGLVLLVLGAGNEQRRRAQERFQEAFRNLR